MLLATLLAGVVLAYVSPYFQSLGQATASVVCDYAAALAQAAAAVLALLNLLEGVAAVSARDGGH